jgi:hypothetical protein
MRRHITLLEFLPQGLDSLRDRALQLKPHTYPISHLNVIHLNYIVNDQRTPRSEQHVP